MGSIPEEFYTESVSAALKDTALPLWSAVQAYDTLARSPSVLQPFRFGLLLRCTIHLQGRRQCLACTWNRHVKVLYHVRKSQHTFVCRFFLPFDVTVHVRACVRACCVFCGQVKLGHSIALEPEGGGGGDTISWDTMGWGYWGYPRVPSVDRWKWLDSRRITNICERWSKDHTNALQHAYATFNLQCFAIYDRIYLSWGGYTSPVCSSIQIFLRISLRRMSNWWGCATYGAQALQRRRI